MTAAAADRDGKRIDGTHLPIPMAASEICYRGAGVCVNTAGNAIAAADAAGNVTMGVAVKQADNSAGSAGDIEVEVETGIFSFIAAAADQTWVGEDVGWTDDQTVDLTITNAESVAGRCVRFVSATEVWVLVGRHHGT